MAGYFAHRMGLPIEKLVVATNENDILERFWSTGRYEKEPPYIPAAAAATAGVGSSVGPVPTAEQAASSGGRPRRTPSPAMDALVSSNMERLLWFLAYEFASGAGMDDEWNKKQAGQEVAAWFGRLEARGGFGPVYKDVLESARRSFDCERVTDRETLETIRGCHRNLNYVLDPHSAVGVAAARRSLARSGRDVLPHIALSTAHPAAYGDAVSDALRDEEGFDFDKLVLPPELRDLDKKERRVATAPNDWKAVRDLIKALVEGDLKGKTN